MGSSGSSFSGIVNDTSCYYEANDNSGCGVTETNDASYGAAFAAAGGGVFVTQLAESGISIWFFSRPDIPDAISNADNEIDTSTLGTPSAYWGTDTCDITKFFGDQSLVFDITLVSVYTAFNFNYYYFLTKVNPYVSAVTGLASLISFLVQDALLCLVLTLATPPMCSTLATMTLHT